MKKWIALLLVFLCVAGMAGCGQTVPAEQTQGVAGEGFRVGYSRAFITPEENLPLGGFGTSATRIMEDVLDDTYVTTIAMTDEDNYTVLLMLVDLQRIEDMLIDLLRSSVSNATGVPKEQIMISCSHTHSIPDLTWDDHEGIIRYKQLLMERFAESAVAALADSKPATMYTGSIDAEGLNFVKHYQHMDNDGVVHYFGDNFGTAVYDETTHHVTQAYDTMHLLQFKREGAKDIVISNFRSHPTLTGGSSELNLSSDFIGPMRESVEAQLDCNFAFMQGACGNINPRSRIADENFGTEKDHRDYGNRLANVAVEGIKNNMTQAKTGKLQSEQINYNASVDHSQDSLLSYALLVQQHYKATGSMSQATQYGRPYGISSYYHAGAIRVKAGLPENQDIEIDTVSIGDTVGFFSAPGELFDLVSVEMEQRSPFDITYTVGFANGDWKYFPYGPCAEYASYESDYGRFAPGTAESMMELWTDSLNTLYENVQ